MRRALTVSLVIAAFGLPIGGSALVALRLRHADAQQFSRPAPLMASPTRADRVLVIAPHPDDESVPCGGLVARAVEVGAAVRVVYATNGDAFRTAAQRLFRVSSVSAKDYVRLGAMRQREALAALADLGVDNSQAVFLGYPDRGLDRMWLEYWEAAQPYRSSFTKTDRNPYPDSVRAGGVYCGSALLDDLEGVMREFGPTMVIAPHPSETHGDHWAMYCYAVAALYELGMLDRVKLWLYLVHPANRWFSRTGELLDPTSPPARTDEVRTRWETLPLSAAEAKRKRTAIGEHRTQLLVMRDWLMNFARGRELYGQVPGETLVRESRAAGFGETAEWRGLPVVALDAAEGKGVSPGAGNILALRAGRSASALMLRLDLAQPPSKKVEYRLHVHEMIDGKMRPPRTYAVRPGATAPGIEYSASGRWLEVIVAEGRATEGAMLGVDTWRGSKQLDRTDWVVLRGGARAGM